MEAQLQTPCQYLPPDILEEIFVRLPIKYIVRFKLLSKSWASLFSQTKFLKRHHDLKIIDGPTSIVTAPPKYCFGDEFYSYAFLDLDDHDDLDNVTTHYCFPYEQTGYIGTPHPRLLGSWNGLVALYDGVRTFVLWNPCTGQYNQVATQVDLHDNTSCQYLLGLCFDPTNDEYMAVVVNYYTHPPPVSHWFGNFDDVYREDCKIGYLVNFKSGKWEELGNSWQIIQWLSFEEQVGVIINGIPHWVDVNPGTRKLFYFDHLERDFKKMAYPSINKKVICGLGALHGQLSVAFGYPGYPHHEPNKTEFEIWVMKNYGVEESWTKLLVMTQEAGVRPYDSLALLGCNGDGEIVVDINGTISRYPMTIDDNQLIVHNPRENSSKEVPASSFGRWCSKATYVPTLISPY